MFPASTYDTEVVFFKDGKHAIYRANQSIVYPKYSTNAYSPENMNPSPYQPLPSMFQRANFDLLERFVDPYFFTGLDILDHKPLINIDNILQYVKGTALLLICVNNKVKFLFDVVQGTLSLNDQKSGFKQQLIDEIEFEYDCWGRVIRIHNINIQYYSMFSTVTINGTPVEYYASWFGEKQILRVGNKYQQAKPSLCTIS